MPHLNRVVLFNAARFDHLDVPLDGHLQVVGSNGHGKSTLLRAVLFFYVGEREDSYFGLKPSQDGFMTYYLGRNPSWLVYGIERGEGQPGFHIAVSRPGGRVHFLFVDAPYDPDLYLDDRRLRSTDEVRTLLLERQIRSHHVGSYEEFRAIVYGGVRSPYNVFETRGRGGRQADVLPRILSGIFTVNRMEAARFKRALTCGLDGDTGSLRLDLSTLRDRLKRFKQVNDAIRAFRAKQGQAHRLVELADTLEDEKKSLEGAVLQLLAHAQTLPAERARIETRQHELGTAREEIERQRAEADHAHSERMRALDGQIGALDASIRLACKYRDEYERLEIARKAAELETLPRLRHERDNARQTRDTLVAQYQDENRRKSDRIAQLESSWQQLDTGLKAREAAAKLDAATAREAATAAELAARSAADEAFNRAAIERQTRDSRLRAEERALSDQLREWARGNAEPQDLKEARARVEALNQRIDENRNTRTKAEAELERLRTTHKLDDQKLRNTEERTQDAFDREKAVLDARLKEAAERVNRHERSLVAWIASQQPQSLDPATRALREDVLFAPAGDLIGDQHAGPVDTAFGIQLRADALPSRAGEYEPGDLQAALAAVEAQRKAYAQRVEQFQQESTTQRTRVERAFLDRQEQVQNRLDVLRKEAADLPQERARAVEDEQRRRAHWENGRKELHGRLEERQHALDARRQQWNTENDAARGEHNRKLKDLAAGLETQCAAIRQAETDRLKGLAEERREARSRHDAAVQDVERDYAAALASRGADTAAVTRADKALQAATAAVSRVEALQEEVALYEAYHKEHISMLPQLTARSDELRNERGAAELAHRDARALGDRQLAAIATETGALRGRLRDVETDEADFKVFRGEFPEFGGWAIEPPVAAAPEFAPLRVHQQLGEARLWNGKVRKTGEEGDKQAQAFLRAFRFETSEPNELGFAPPGDNFSWYEFVGGQLRPFVRHNRIAHLETTQTRQFREIITYLNNRTSELSDAIRKVRRIASQVQKSLTESNFTDVIDSLELDVQDVPSPLLQQLRSMEDFHDLAFDSASAELFTTGASDGQTRKAVAAFEKLVSLLDEQTVDSLDLDDLFEMRFQVSENGRLYGWRTSLDHIGSTGTDYLIKMLIYLSLIDVHRQQALGSQQATVHCILDETGVLATRFVRAVLDYATRKGILLVTAGHAQQTSGFDHWFLVRKRGQDTFTGAEILRRKLVCK